MTDNRVMKLWTAIITAFLALCTALGLVTTTASTAVAQSEPTRNSGDSGSAVPANVAAESPWAWLLARSLPPTMKQRIHAEAHGKSPSCRRRPLPETEADDRLAAPCSTETETDPAAEPAAPLQR
ncbi:DUF6344 domain-containing protein [Streptomyces sp. NPDC006622]|uniref:DUF6344 domain-containing protein n=1 Tax=Streptomyces sp. NPDC006622 TaxID=3155459 RepID=UPI0033B1A947